jgi:hypothetical protein
VKKVETSSISAGFDEDMGDIESYTPQRKPSLNELPKFVEKGKASEIPEFIEGFKHHRRR